MTYVKQTWQDNNGAYPVSAVRLQHIEDGLDAVANGTLSVTGDITLQSTTGSVLWKNSVLVHQAGHDPADIVVGSTVFEVDKYGNFLLGLNPLVTTRTGNLAANGWIPTGLMWQQESRLLNIGGGGLAVRVVGDPGDFVLGRAGPDNAWPDNGGLGIAGVPSGTSLGSIRFQGAATPNGGTPDVTLGAEFQGDSAQIYAKASEDNVKVVSSYHQGGQLHFATTPNGASVSVDALVIRNDGVLDVMVGPIQYTETADPAAGASNTARVYCRDNGSGKTQLCVRFSSGAVQVIATQP